MHGSSGIRERSMPEIDVYTSNLDAQNLFPPKAAEYSALRFLKGGEMYYGEMEGEMPVCLLPRSMRGLLC